MNTTHDSVVDHRTSEEKLTSNLLSTSSLSLHDITVFFFVPVGFKHVVFILKATEWNPLTCIMTLMYLVQREVFSFGASILWGRGSSLKYKEYFCYFPLFFFLICFNHITVCCTSTRSPFLIVHVAFPQVSLRVFLHFCFM